jgi:hypothetical protein
VQRRRLVSYWAVIRCRQRGCSAFQVDLSVSMTFRQPTVARRATVIEGMWNDEIQSMSEEQVTRLVPQHGRNI